MTKKKIILFMQILFVVSWMVIIFCFSNQTSSDSSELSSNLLYKIVEKVKGHELTTQEKTRIRKKYSYYIRKLAHFFLYFVLGIVVYASLCLVIKSPVKTVIFTIIICFLYACSDEFHQMFVPGRDGRFFDVLVDICGSLLSLALILLLRSFINFILMIRNSIRKKKEVEVIK